MPTTAWTEPTHLPNRPEAGLRRLGPADLACFQALASETFTETFAHFHDPADFSACLAEAFEAERLRAQLDDPMNAVWAVLDGGTPSGFLQLRHTTAAGDPPPEGVAADLNWVRLWRLYLFRPYHGRGLADALMQMSLDWATAQGATGVWLTVWDRNPRAWRFYERWGFRPVGRIRFDIGGEESWDTLMTRTLAP